MKIDWMAKLRHLLQVLAFCLVVATIQYAFQPERPYGPPVVYSLFIGSITWAVIDVGRDLFPSSAETGWPRGWAGLALVIGGIAAGYLLGHTIADKLCLYFGFYPPGPNLNQEEQLRTSILITVLAGIAGSFYFYSINKSAYLQRKMGEATPARQRGPPEAAGVAARAAHAVQHAGQPARADRLRPARRPSRCWIT